MWTWLRRLLAVLACVKLVSLCAMAFHPINPPHNWRQVDTVGVAQRYWLRWTVEDVSLPEALYPAVLLSRDTKGIMAQEFPVINLALAPTFALGDHWGRIGAHLVFTAMLIGLFVWNLRLWRPKSILGVPGDLLVLLLPCFGFMVPYWGRVIPDMISGLLVLGGVGLWWRDDFRQARWAVMLGALCFALAVLIKPPAIIGATLLLLHPRLREDGPVMIGAGLLALVPGAHYYTRGIAFLRTLEAGDLPPFAVDRKDVWAAWTTVVADPIGLFDTLAKEAFNYGGLLVLPVMAALFCRRFKRLGLAVLVFVVAFIGALTLAGSHVFLHSYYLVPLAPMSAVVFLLVWEGVTTSPARASLYGQGLLALLLVGSFLTYLPMDHVSWRIPGRSAELFSQCEELKKAAPSWPWKHGQAFRSSEEAYPLLGLCFGERVGSRTASLGFFYTSESLPAGCHATHQTRLIMLATCG